MSCPESDRAACTRLPGEGSDDEEGAPASETSSRDLEVPICAYVMVYHRILVPVMTLRSPSMDLSPRASYEKPGSL